MLRPSFLVRFVVFIYRIDFFLSLLVVFELHVHIAVAAAGRLLCCGSLSGQDAAWFLFMLLVAMKQPTMFGTPVIENL